MNFTTRWTLTTAVTTSCATSCPELQLKDLRRSYTSAQHELLQSMPPSRRQSRRQLANQLLCQPRNQRAHRLRCLLQRQHAIQLRCQFRRHLSQPRRLGGLRRPTHLLGSNIQTATRGLRFYRCSSPRSKHSTRRKDEDKRQQTHALPHMQLLRSCVLLRRRRSSKSTLANYLHGEVVSMTLQNMRQRLQLMKMTKFFQRR